MHAAAITLFVPGPLRHVSGGLATLPLEAKDVRGVLHAIERQHPALHRLVCDETGAVRRHLNVFVNTAHIRDLEGLDTTLTDGDQVLILPAVSGG